MSLPAVNPYLASQLAAHAYAPKSANPLRRMSITGWALFFSALLVALSGYERFRIPLGGLQVHAYLVLVGPLFLLMLLTRIQKFPAATLFAFSLFTIGFCFSTLADQEGALQESTKVAASLATLVATALLVRTEGDFRAGVVGLTLAVAGMSLYGLLFSVRITLVGIDPIDTGNENGFSLYSLPPLLLSIYLMVDKSVKLWVRTLLAAMCVVIILVMFSNANRSGWLGVAIVGMMGIGLVGKERRLPAIISVAVLTIGGVVAMYYFGDTDTLKFRWGQTFSGETSDNLRVSLFMACLRLGIENPIFGVGPQNVPSELSRIVGQEHYFIDPHNLPGYLIAGSGLVVSALFAWGGYTLWAKPPGLNAKIPKGAPLTPQRAAHRLMRMMLGLYAIRCLFSREILYAPGFVMGVGLCIGLEIVHSLYTRPKRSPLPPMHPAT